MVSPRGAKCPVCAAGEDLEYRSRRSLNYCVCRNCGLTFANPLTPDDHPSVAGAESTRTKDEYNQRLVSDHSMRTRAAKPVVRGRTQLYSVALGRPVSAILDVGCADGCLYPAFHELGVSWDGIDINPEMVAFAQSTGVPVQLQDFLTRSYAVRYDVVYLSQVLEHVLRPNEFIAKAHNLLVRGGLLHLDVPNHCGLVPTFRKLCPVGNDYGMLQPPYHLVAYNGEALEYLLCKHGFEIVLLGSYANDDPVFGQILIRSSALDRLLYSAARLLNAGSLLVAVARRIA